MGLLALVVSLLVAGCGGGNVVGCEELPGVRVCPLPVEQRPDVPTDALPVLGAPDQQLSLEEFRGDIVVVNFWASWCGPCRSEQPVLNAVHDRFVDQGVSFVGVDVQEASETNGLVHEEEFDIPYPSMWDPATTFAGSFRGIGPQTLPATVLVDRQGRLAVSLIGETNAIELTELLEALIEEAA